MTGFEKGHIEGTMGPFLDRMMLEKRQFFAYEPLPVGRSDKEARATTIRAMMQAGIVIWDRNDAAQNEAKAVMLKFPNGKHDDRRMALDQSPHFPGESGFEDSLCKDYAGILVRTWLEPLWHIVLAVIVIIKTKHGMAPLADRPGARSAQKGKRG